MQPKAFCNFPSFAVVNSYDPDAELYFAAVASDGYVWTDAEKTAVNRWFLDVKGETNPNYATSNIYSKIPAAYLYNGGTAATHKWNAVNPINADSSYRLVFYGGLTHNANGITGNAVNAYADTFIDPNTVFTINNKAITLYMRSVGTNAQTGVYTSGFAGDLVGIDLFGDFYHTISASTGGLPAPATLAGAYTFSRQDAAGYRVVKDGALFQNRVLASSVNPTGKYPLLARRFNVVTIDNYDAGNLCFAAFSTGLTETECINFHNAINALQTALGRNVY